MILVTGGTGLVGSHLLFELAKSGNQIRALYRTEEKLQAVRNVFSFFTDEVNELFSSIDWVKGDILNVPLLHEQFKDIKQAYHCAALVSFDPNDYHSLRKINIEGTANIVNLCIENKVEKLCYVSSIAAIGDEKPGETITEESPWNPEGDHNVYAITKYGAEMEVWRGTQEGLDAVIVNPGIVLGGGFWYSGSGSLFRKIANGLTYYTRGKTGYIDVRDVTKIMILLMKSDFTNERYILVAENWGFKEFTQETAKRLNVSIPQKKANAFLLNIAWRMDWLRHFLRGKRRRITKQTARSLQTETVYSNSKIKSALNIEFKPIKTSISEVSQLFLQKA